MITTHCENIVYKNLDISKTLKGILWSIVKGTHFEYQEGNADSVLIRISYMYTLEANFESFVNCEIITFHSSGENIKHC